MSRPLIKGGNVSLTRQAPGLTAVTAELHGAGGAPGGPAAAALLCDEHRRALSGDHLVGRTRPADPDGAVRDAEAGAGGNPGHAQFEVDLGRMPAGAEAVVFVVAGASGAPGAAGSGRIGEASLRIADRDTGAELARYDLTGQGPAAPSAVVFGELYRHGAEWKFRAIGQGYAAGLAGIAADYGADELLTLLGHATPATPVAPAQGQGRVEGQADGSASGMQKPAAVPEPTALAGPAGPAGFDGRAPAGAVPVPSPDDLCFFDPGHGPGLASVLWSPQWGVPRPIQTCADCAHRVQSSPPPYYPAAAPGAAYGRQYPPASPYPPQGYPAPYGEYPHHGGHHHGGHGEHYEHGEDHGGQRFGMGAVIGAGAAGLIGGILLDEALDDD